MAAGAIIRALGWLVRHSHDEEHDKDGDVLREMVVEARNELDAFGAATINHRHEVAALLAEIERLREYERMHGVRSNEIGKLKTERDLADGIERGDHHRTCLTCGRTFSTPQGLGQHFAWRRRGKRCER